MEQFTIIEKTKEYRVEEVLGCLSKIRTGIVIQEFDLQNQISKLLEQDGVSYQKEYKLGPRNRIDFFIPGGIGIEIKKGKPNQSQVINQLYR